jgi:light-regulated signal transduction histidine kinase (bacteriophytochrome)
MLYKFLEDFSGRVIADVLTPAHSNRDSYLNLRFPSTDIPKQVRALYTLQPLRLIPDASEAPSPLYPPVNPITNDTTDLSYSFLRGVSLMHTEYLQNMEVQASMSLAIMHSGTLWGLIACHHYTPRRIDYDVRTACEFLARVVSLQLPKLESEEDFEYRKRIDDLRFHFTSNMARIRDLKRVLTASNPGLIDLIECGGCAVLLNSECSLFGATPCVEDVQAIALWLIHNQPHKVYATSKLPAVMPQAIAFQQHACGILAIQLPQPGEYILWFRPEVASTVNWAGNPTKLSKSTPFGEQLTPRVSFAIWQETVLGTSLDWLAVEIEAVTMLRFSVIEALAGILEELSVANTLLTKANAELDAFVYIASHDLKEPLRGICNFALFLQEDFGHLLPEKGLAQLGTVQKLGRRMGELIDSLIRYSRASASDLELQQCDLNVLVREELDSLELRIRETNADVRILRTLPCVVCSQIQIGQVFQNLIINALKYNSSEKPLVEISYLEQETGGDTIYSVRDNGIGIDAEHLVEVFKSFRRLHGANEYGGGTGLGLAIVRRIIERHGGRAWIESTLGVGTTFYFTLTGA